jgi:anhydro-N-acetylmuramic acid kinase
MLYLGLMSGTSLDGVDGVVADLQGSAPRVLAHVHRPFDAHLRESLLQLNTPGRDELHRAALAANGVARTYGEVVDHLLQRGRLRSRDIRAIGAHGQTVRHRPLAFDGTGYTVQLLNGALLAEHCGIDVVCDLRSRDIAAGGQGAPLVPAFHAGLFGRSGHAVAVLNVGGIANLTLLGAEPDDVRGFDCGPGNALMDGWCLRHTGRPYDDAGRWAASGRVDLPLLEKLLSEPYFALSPPKSTGRDLFNESWLDAALQRRGAEFRPVDVQATLAELTARAAAQALAREGPDSRECLVCGGGAFNTHLMQRLAVLAPGVAVLSTAAHGVPPDQVEALAFAWLARQFVEGRPGNLPAVTGARGPRVLGVLHPAGQAA